MDVLTWASVGTFLRSWVPIGLYQLFMVPSVIVRLNQLMKSAIVCNVDHLFPLLPLQVLFFLLQTLQVLVTQVTYIPPHSMRFKAKKTLR